MVTREPEFDEETRALHEANLYLDDMTCGTCGNDLRLTTDPALQEMWQADDATVCRACAVREVLQRTEGNKKTGAKHRHDDDPSWPGPHYSEGRLFLVRLLDEPPSSIAPEVTP